MKLWIIQFGLSFFFIIMGTLQIVLPAERMAKIMNWVKDFKPLTVKLIGAVEVVVAIGLILPEILDIDPLLTPLSAWCMAVVMIGAIRTNFKRQESGMVMLNILLFVLLAVVAIGRMSTLDSMGN